MAQINIAPTAHAFEKNHTVVNALKDELRTLSNWFQTFRQTLKAKYNIQDIFIGGGSSRELLDNARGGEDLHVLSDFDIFAIANQKVTVELAQEISQSLTKAGLGDLVPGSLEKRLRGNPDIPESAERYSYDPGSGFLLRDSKILGDINIFHSFKDLQTNGIFSLDTVYLKVPWDQTLEEFYEDNLSVLSIAELIRTGQMYDPNDGYEDWVNEKIRVVNPAELIRDPILKATRIIRSFAKIHKLNELQASEAWSQLRNKIKGSSLKDPVRFHRNLLKVLKLEDAALALKLLSDSGALRKYDSQFDDLVRKVPRVRLEELTNKSLSPEEKFQRIAWASNLRSSLESGLSAAELINCQISVGEPSPNIEGE